MSLWTSEAIANAVGSAARSHWDAVRVNTDSRTLAAGDLFVALRGERFDGHDFVAEALKAGAAGALVSYEPEGCKDDPRLILVSDTLTALQQLGKAGRDRSAAKVVGVTGSVGKTSCKEALAIAFGGQARTYASVGNLNNHIGMPLTLANMPQDTQVAVLEMGMNHGGEIDLLSKLAQPHVAIITAVEAVHIEFFENGLEGIADAKSEIAAGMQPGGTLVLPADNAYLPRLRENAAQYKVARVMTFGEAPEADYRLLDYRTLPVGSQAHVQTPKGRIDVRLGAVGRHWGLMTAGVLALLDALGYDLQKAAAALAQFSEPAGRGKAQEVRLPGGRRVLVLDDSYNASAASMRAAFARLEEIWQARGQRGRKLAALGDMRELGQHSAELHTGLAPELARLNITLHAAGPEMRRLHEALTPNLRGAWRDDADGLSADILSLLEEGDVLLVKGSRGSRMDKIVSAVLTADTSAQPKVRHAV
jgi:UDP-N-acetylmuramoyl-tripeptide--D-alanyl-D-alanine ligase